MNRRNLLKILCGLLFVPFVKQETIEDTIERNLDKHKIILWDFQKDVIKEMQQWEYKPTKEQRIKFYRGEYFPIKKMYSINMIIT